MDDTLHRLYAHLAWADDRTLESLRTTSDVDPAVLRLFAHVIGSERVWLERIEGDPAALRGESVAWPGLTLDECETLARDVHARFSALIASLDDAGLERMMTYKNSQRLEFQNSVRNALLHVALHGSYHRGQIAARLRANGGTPAVTDYSVFVRERNTQ